MHLARFRGLEAIMALALASMAYSFVLSRGSLVALIPFQALAIFVPVLAMLCGRRSELRLSELVLWLVISAFLALSVLVNMPSYKTGSTTLSFAVVHLCGLVAMLLALLWTAYNLRPEIVFRNVAILLLPLVAGAVLIGLLDGGFLLRQAPLGIHPNWWGELAISFIFGALVISGWVYRFLLVTMASLLLVLVQSRGAILSVGVGVILYCLLSFREVRVRRSRVAVVLLLGLVGVSVAASLPGLPQATYDFVVGNVLVLNDPNRGVGTGLTGRLEGWQQGATVFSENLIFGGGLDTLPDVHNGFLRVAGENGLGFLLLLAFLISRAFHESYVQANAWRFAVVGAYFVYAMTYPRMLNMNLTATLFVVCLFSWKRRDTPDELERQHMGT
jgi:hypothetical protein